MKKSLHKPRQLKLTRQTIRHLSTPQLDGVQGGAVLGTTQVPYTSACAGQTDKCANGTR